MDDAVALSAPSGGDDAVAVASGHAHPEPAQYVRIAAILAVATAIEVGIYYIDLPAKLMVAVLVGLASAKFALVAAYFMHLKFDARLLRRVFLTGVILACVVYAIALFTLNLLFH